MSGPIAYVHVLFAGLALVTGAWIFSIPRGTAFHKRLGYCYVVSMLAMNASALLLYARTGAFGPFHAAALISLATLFAGFLPALFRKPRRGWLPLHWELMSWSFVGLVAGAVAETIFRVPGMAYWPSIVGASLLVFLLGGGWIYGSKGAMREFIGARGQAPRDTP